MAGKFHEVRSMRQAPAGRSSGRDYDIASITQVKDTASFPKSDTASLATML
jgi:hypothetical protein